MDPGFLEKLLNRLLQSGVDLDNLPNEVLYEAFQDELQQRREDFLQEYLGSFFDRFKSRDEDLEGFRSRLYARIGGAFELLELTLLLSENLGEEFNSEEQAESLKLASLKRLHARACQIGNEIVWLLRGGFATAAQARWRTLHEVVVVAGFLQEHSEELAERYWHHHHIESWRAMREYRRHWERLGFDALSAEEVSGVEDRRRELVERFGKPYKDPYGWASDVISQKQVGFSDIERAVNLDHWRPFYRLASHGVHANSKGILYTLEQGHHPAVLLTGPSDQGLDEPGQCTAISIGQVTAFLIAFRPTVRRAAALATLNNLIQATIDAFTGKMPEPKPG